MSRRADPARVDEARRAAIRNRLIGEGMTEATAEAWIAAWDVQAAQSGIEPGRVYYQSSRRRLLGSWPQRRRKSAATQTLRFRTIERPMAKALVSSSG